MGVGQSSIVVLFIYTTPLTLGRAGIVHGNIKYVLQVPTTVITYVLYFRTNIILLVKYESNDKKYVWKSENESKLAVNFILNTF